MNDRTNIRHDKKRDEYRIWRGSNKNPSWVKFPLNSADAARVCGIDDSDWKRFGRFLRGSWRPYLQELGVKKTGPENDDWYLVEKHHAQQAAREPRLVQASEELGLRLTPPPG